MTTRRCASYICHRGACAPPLWLCVLAKRKRRRSEVKCGCLACHPPVGGGLGVRPPSPVVFHRLLTPLMITFSQRCGSRFPVLPRSVPTVFAFSHCCRTRQKEGTLSMIQETFAVPPSLGIVRTGSTLSTGAAWKPPSPPTAFGRHGMERWPPPLGYVRASTHGIRTLRRVGLSGREAARHTWDPSRERGLVPPPAPLRLGRMIPSTLSALACWLG